MGERKTSVDPEVKRAADLKVREMKIRDEELALVMDQNHQNFPKGTYPRTYAFWVNPEEMHDKDKPEVIIIPHEGIRKILNRPDGERNVRDPKRLSYDEYQRYFQKGLALFREFSQIESIVRRWEMEPQDLKDLVYGIWRTGGGDEEFGGDGIMMIDNDKIQVTLSEPEDDHVTIAFYNGLSEDSGEEVELENDGEGNPEWRIGTYKSFYSELLEKSFEMQKSLGEPIYSKNYLNSSEIGAIARQLAKRYIEARSKGQLPKFY